MRFNSLHRRSQTTHPLRAARSGIHAPQRELRDRTPPFRRRRPLAKVTARDVDVIPSLDIQEELASGQRGPILGRVESILFLSREPMNTRKIAQFAGLNDGTQARTLIRQLNKLYDRDQMAFRVEHIAGGYQLLTRPEFAPWLRKLGRVPREWRLSEPAIETLAVVAYRQPVLRADVETIRGVACGEILRQLMDRELVRIGGRSEELGRPYLYTTTRRFLQMFGLSSLDKLPRAEEMRKPSGFD